MSGDTSILLPNRRTMPYTESGADKNEIYKYITQNFNDPSIVISWLFGYIENNMGDRTSLVEYRFLSNENLKTDEMRKFFQDPELAKSLDNREAASIGCLLGLVIGDSIGAPLEFTPYTKTPDIFYTGLLDTRPWDDQHMNRFSLLPGQWTDDTSMALCLADSMIYHKGQTDLIDQRLRYALWWFGGMNNGFELDPDRYRGRKSIGLGGNISQSVMEFVSVPLEELGDGRTKAGDTNTSGNGSLMRLAPIPITHWRDPVKCAEVAALSSLATHQGTEAADACRLVACIISYFIQYSVGNNKEKCQVLKESVLNNLEKIAVNEAGVTCSSLLHLARSECEAHDTENRNWNWKRMDWYEPSPKRVADDDCYVGSYVMDALCISLHCLWSTSDFLSAVLKAANYRGDADTIAAITGQFAGALYGVNAIPIEWIEKVWQWDGQGRIAARALLMHRMLQRGDTDDEGDFS